MTDSSVAAQCEKCGGKVLLVERYISMETYRCKACGHLQYSHVSVPVSDLEEFAKTLKTVFISWEIKPDAKQLSELRKLLPELKAETLLTLKERLIESSKWNLGKYSEEDAIDLSKRISALGIRKVIIDT